ncbi:uncharacterized protein GGS22DRAFT_163871 [Annulohypoxylon maeteangense]|uniref:uncharacterized protein n=1 Tax=Annulohypoxylon maeteangense TaxID=1927788 RepID=UPI002007D411|nr:uncharacterized protein GGS22DRAFT_163871 [Annulohypoxylon maeteangense]KAI0884598.1 hypothetical protein GGS22DRAFT_163871 [Annulohypoxylon maeteangense]
MMQALRSKSTAREGSEEDKWHAIYEILFGVPRELQPSPYTDEYLHTQAQAQALVNFLEHRIGPTVRRLLRERNVAQDWEEDFSRDMTNEIIGLINSHSQSLGPSTVPNHDHDSSPNSSSETRGEMSSSRTNHTAQSHTEDGNSTEFGGNATSGGLFGDEYGVWGVGGQDGFENDLMSGMNAYLASLGD